MACNHVRVKLLYLQQEGIEQCKLIVIGMEATSGECLVGIARKWIGIQTPNRCPGSSRILKVGLACRGISTYGWMQAATDCKDFMRQLGRLLERLQAHAQDSQGRA